ncbi:MAG: acetyl-CoA carboxylase carboxyltransferase subunit alpha [bacterium]|nr:acetyl-CoA carboxylase carboxyltransferase subunit alpha [bacterium]
MKLTNMFKKNEQLEGIKREEGMPDVPIGLVKKCNKCKSMVFVNEVKENYYICPKCGGYLRIHAYRRVEMLADQGVFHEWDKDVAGKDPLQFEGYPEKLDSLREKTSLKEAVVTGRIRIEETPVAIGVMDNRFLMGSMGEAVGERITRMFERATIRNLPVILFCTSGGARMQEGITSLMQMAKTSAAIKRHSDAGGLFISILTDPTMGGVTASFAMLGDIILAEPKALIGFAGPRVIEQTIGSRLPKGFQRSEFLLEHGFIDGIVERKELKHVLGRLLLAHSGKTKAEDSAVDQLEEVLPLKEVKKDAWDRVEISRKKDRPVGEDYIDKLFPEFYELHGDRCYGDDKAIIGGIAMFHGTPVTVIAQSKGHTTSENITRNFGMPSPEGYRKTLRLMKQAEKFHRPIFLFVDTPGAFCGLEAEERGQGEAIAKNLYELSSMKVPIVSLIIGEGGSGGALAMAVADEVWMLENSVYSILSPEGYASILWKDSKLCKKAASVMKMTAFELQKQGVIEKILAEPDKYSVETMQPVIEKLDYELYRFLKEREDIDGETLINARYNRFRQM